MANDDIERLDDAVDQLEARVGNHDLLISGETDRLTHVRVEHGNRLDEAERGIARLFAMVEDGLGGVVADDDDASPGLRADVNRLTGQVEALEKSLMYQSSQLSYKVQDIEESLSTLAEKVKRLFSLEDRVPVVEAKPERRLNGINPDSDPEKCKDCRFGHIYFDACAPPGDDMMTCRLNPSPVKTADDHWCGQWEPRK